MTFWKKAAMGVIAVMFVVSAHAMTEDKKAKKYFLEGYEAMQAGDLEKGEKEFLKALERDPSFYEAHLEYGRLLAQMSRYDDAKKQLAEAQKLDPEGGLKAVGLLYAVAREENNLEEQAKYALEKLEILGDEAKDNDVGRVDALAIEFVKAGNMKRAEEIYRKLIELQPGYAYGYLNLGKSFFMANQKDKGIEVFEMAVDAGVDNTELDYLLGTIYHDDKAFDKALPLLKKAAEEQRFRKNVYPMLINCYISGEDLEEAKATCEAYLNEFPAAENRKAVEDRLAKIEKNIEILKRKEAQEK